MAVALVLASGTALAVNTVCKGGGVGCTGTSGNDILIGTSSRETLKGLEGSDHIIGNAENDTLNGAAGSDTYTFTNDFGADKLNDTGPAKEKDTVDFSKILPGVNGMRIRVIPEWEAATGVPQYNNAFLQDNLAGPRVDFGSTTTIERIVGSAGRDILEGGKQANTYDLSAGGNDSVLDRGGVPERPTFPVLPASNDTYTGYKSGHLRISDDGGSGDVLDLKPSKATDVSFGKDANNLLLITGPAPNEVIEIVDYFSTTKKIEKMVFADRTITGISLK